METHITNVIYKLHDEIGIDIEHYTIAPDQEENPTCHEWIIELRKPTDMDQAYLTKKIDLFLQENNADYQSKRK